MEERLIDKERERKITIKRNAIGGVEDAVEEGTPLGEEGTEEEVEIDFPEEYDEDLVGLTPSQLEETLAAREKAAKAARAEYEKMLAEANRALAAKDYESAEPFFVQALLYDAESKEAKEGIWTCRTQDFTDLEALFTKQSERMIAAADSDTKRFLKSRAGEELKQMRKAAFEEADPLSVQVNEARKTRRAAFEENRNYYLVRFFLFLTFTLIALVAAGISALFIVRTQSILPVVFTAVFGGVCFILLLTSLVLGRKFDLARRMVILNEKPTSTEDGKRLLLLNNRIQIIDSILEEE